MNIYARFDENPAMTLQDIKKTKCYGRMHTRMDAQTDVKTVYPPQKPYIKSHLELQREITLIELAPIP